MLKKIAFALTISAIAGLEATGNAEAASLSLYSSDPIRVLEEDRNKDFVVDDFVFEFTNLPKAESYLTLNLAIKGIDLYDSPRNDPETLTAFITNAGTRYKLGSLSPFGNIPPHAYNTTARASFLLSLNQIGGTLGESLFLELKPSSEVNVYNSLSEVCFTSCGGFIDATLSYATATATDIPEPTSVLGLLAGGAVLAGGALKKKAV